MPTSKTWSDVSTFERETGVRSNGIREQISSCSLPFIVHECKVDHRKTKYAYKDGKMFIIPKRSRDYDSVFQEIPYHTIDLHKEWGDCDDALRDDNGFWPVQLHNIAPVKPRMVGKGTYGVVKQFETIHGKKVAIKSIDIETPLSLETGTIRQCILDPETIETLHAYHQDELHYLNQFVKEAQYSVFMGREHIGPHVHFVLFSYWPVDGKSSWNVSICMDYFDCNAEEYIQQFGHRNISYLEHHVTRLFRRLTNRKVFCIDVKLSNIVIKHTDIGIGDIRLIDFDSGWCERRWSNIPGPVPSIFQSVTGIGRTRRTTMMFLMQFFMMLHTAHYHDIFFCMNAVWKTVRNHRDIIRYAKHYFATRFDNMFSLHYFKQSGSHIFEQVVQLLETPGHISTDRTTLLFDTGRTLSLQEKIVLFTSKNGNIQCSSDASLQEIATHVQASQHTSLADAISMLYSLGVVPILQCRYSRRRT